MIKFLNEYLYYYVFVHIPKNSGTEMSTQIKKNISKQ